MLGLTDAELGLMKDAESAIIKSSQEAYSEKKEAFGRLLKGRDMEEVLLEKMQKVKISGALAGGEEKLDANREFKDRISDITWDRFPIVLLGGSFNTENRATRITEAGKKELDALLKFLNPDEVCFVIGHKISGYEKYLLDHNKKGFRVYAVVPALVTAQERDRLMSYPNLQIRVSTESQGMGIYKSFNYEIFERRPSMVVAFDGNSAAGNLIQEARNGKGKSAILVWSHSKNLRPKVSTLGGYVYTFDEENGLVSRIKDLQKGVPG